MVSSPLADRQMSLSDGSHRALIYDLDLPALEALLVKLGEPRFRVDQLWRWLYVDLAREFADMTNLPLSLRAALANATTIAPLEVCASIRSATGQTQKDALKLADGAIIEAVLMRYERRRTACVSTQVGCAIGCPFCATGQMGFARDLSAGEIVSQVVHFARALRECGDRLTNVVLMGMGEPLLNYEASVAAVRRITDQRAIGLGQRRITLSTVGVAPAIERFAAEGLETTLAVSLHAATDELRNRLVPINRRYPLRTIMQACRVYARRTRRRISFEWALIEGVNDSIDQAAALASLLDGIPSHVNLIPLNPIAEYVGRAPNPRKAAGFLAELEQRQVPFTVRTRRGSDIQAGCGQLAALQPGASRSTPSDR